MRRLVFLFVLVLAAVPSLAEEARCPHEISACLNMFGRMRERPWMGVELEADSTGRRVVHAIVPGGPSDRAGMRVGDVLLRIEGKPPLEWFAGKTGWKDGEKTSVTVERKGRETQLEMPCEAIPEEKLVKAIGVHMIEGHLAWSGQPEEPRR